MGEQVLSEKDIELAFGAFNEFEKKNWSAALQYLEKIDRPDDYRIGLNKSVIEYYESNFTNFEKFVLALNVILDNPGEVRQNTLLVAAYNKSLLLYHLKKPLSALTILITLMKFLDEMSDELAKKGGLLTLTCLLDTNQSKMSEALLKALQVRLGGRLSDLFCIEADDLLEVIPKKTKSTFDREFEKMFRTCVVRSNLMNNRSFVIYGNDASDISILRAHQYLLNSDYQMAAKELSKEFPNEPHTILANGEDRKTFIANNMGIIHFHVRHYAMAARFFQHALTFDKITCDMATNDSPTHFSGATKKHEILYNLGVSLLHLQRPKEAFECLLVPLNYYHNNPKLWLRLAEACIMTHKQSEKQKQKTKLITSVIGSGPHRKYIIQPTPHKYVSDESQSCAIPSPNLEFAALCCRNALSLIDNYSNTYLDEPEDNSWYNAVEKLSCNPSKTLILNTTLRPLQIGVLSAAAYVNLCLGEYTLSLKYAEQIFNMGILTGMNSMIGNLYRAESLIMLNRVTEARNFIKYSFIANLTEEDFVTQQSPECTITSLSAAKCVLKYNFAVTLTLEGHLERARSILMECTDPVMLDYVKILQIYIEMQMGQIENCKMLIRNDSPWIE